jgi:hypothetical protein
MDPDVLFSRALGSRRGSERARAHALPKSPGTRARELTSQLKAEGDISNTVSPDEQLRTWAARYDLAVELLGTRDFASGVAGLAFVFSLRGRFSDPQEAGFRAVLVWQAATWELYESSPSMP